jgi:hypothetical protein
LLLLGLGFLWSLGGQRKGGWRLQFASSPVLGPAVGYSSAASARLRTDWVPGVLPGLGLALVLDGGQRMHV